MRRYGIYYLISALIALWIYAAGSKLSSFDLFMAQLKRQPLPDWSLSFLHVGIPAIELLAAVFLCFKRTLMSGLLLSIFLLTAFTIYIGFGLANIYGSIPCSCGGILGSISWGGHLIFNIIFLLIAIAGTFLWAKFNRDNLKDRFIANG